MNIFILPLLPFAQYKNHHLLPKNSKIKFGDFFTSLSPKVDSNLYSLISENLLVDLVSVFEAYLQNIIEHLLSKNQHLVFTKDKQISASDLLQINDIEQLKKKLIEEKVRKLMYETKCKYSTQQCNIKH